MSRAMRMKVSSLSMKMICYYPEIKLEVYRNKVVQDAFPVVKYFYIRIPKIDRRLMDTGSVICPAFSAFVGGSPEPAFAVEVVRQAVDRAEASREAFEGCREIRAFVAHRE